MDASPGLGIDARSLVGFGLAAVNPAMGGLWARPPVRLTKGELLWRPITLDEAGKRGFADGNDLSLDEFVSLESASDSEILSFARKHGVLGVAKDGLPATPVWADNEIPSYRPGFGPLGWPDECRDSVETWRLLARDALSMLNIAYQLRGADTGREADWLRIFDSGPVDRHTDRLEPLFELLRGDGGVAIGRMALTSFVNGWLDRSGIGFSLYWGDERGDQPMFRVSPNGLFGAIAIKVALAVGGREGFAFCAVCAFPITPKRRQPRNRNSYCDNPDCRIKGRDRIAKQKSRREAREQEKRGDDGKA